MDWIADPDAWLSRLVLQRGLAVVYLMAFLSTAREFPALAGERGLAPAPAFARRAPGLFRWWRYTDRRLLAVAWTGAALSAALAAGLADIVPLWASMLLWAVLWALYLSVVNIGGVWYAFGWESLLLEAGFLAVFLGNDDVAPPTFGMYLMVWLAFRVELGAGLIKWRGDPCWRDLTCLCHHHETQPMPGPLSRLFHLLPRPLHRVEAAANHVCQLIVPFGLFLPQPVATWAALLVIVTQLWLVASGNFAWLNWLTMLLALAAVHPARLPFLPSPPAGQEDAPLWFSVMVWAVALLVAVLSYQPVRNLFSRYQSMNRTYNGLHLVNTYGAFGSVTRVRHEIELEGTRDGEHWRAYGFHGKPGDVRRVPRQFAPFHLRLDWLMWFAALNPSVPRPWMRTLIRRLLDGDPAILRLLRVNPFPDAPPAQIRARVYRYRFSTHRELRETGARWQRTYTHDHIPPTPASGD
ncbi:lipase maturation factor family protein [Streptomyces sp. NPDC049879]|uniref:lipase maturation factor family protein n=1 Tax=Streptomyces sp. NPDC049879 TaxID=3365598 RepID=UPI0037B83031